MKKKTKNIAAVISLLALCLQAPTGTAQYINRTYDYDSTDDFGFNVFVQADSNYFTFGGRVNGHTNQDDLASMIITKNGINILSKKSIGLNYASIYNGRSGRMKILPNGNYLVPMSLQYFKPSRISSMAGIAKLDALGDTIFIRTYTDTNKKFEIINDCDVLADRGYILVGGSADTAINSNYNILLCRTDSMGNLLWRKSFIKSSFGFNAIANSVATLPGGRLLVGAYFLETINLGGGNSYDKHIPWYMVLDSGGNIIKDAIWGSGYNGYNNGCSIFKDANGGYYTWGAYDSLFSADPSDDNNFPNYIAHLDSNFNTKWINDFPFTIPQGHKDVWNISQLHDSCYLIVGTKRDSTSMFNDKGWAAKIDKNGKTMWEHEYVVDITNESYLVDAKEKPDGGIVMVGAATNSSLPAWRQQDVWLVVTDSNGCEMPGCSSLNVAPSSSPQGGVMLRVYPNPASDYIIIENAAMGSAVKLYNLLGQEVYSGTISSSKEQINTGGLIPGSYLLQLINKEGVRWNKTVVKE